MSGFAEAGAVLGLISSIITIVETAKDLYEAANDANGHSYALSNAAAKLPLVAIILRDAEEYAKLPTTDDATRKAIRELLEPDERRATELRDILQKVVPKDRASTFDKYRTATRKMMKGGRVETLIKAILQDMQVLSTHFSCPKTTKSALEEALDEVEISVPDGLKPLKGIKFNTPTPYSSLNSIKELKDFLHSWLLPENWPAADYESDHALILGKRFCNPETSYSSCKWVFETPEYLKFLDPGFGSIFKIKGPSGCGKSFLLSSIIDTLKNQQAGSAELYVLYCYAQNEVGPTSTTTIARILLAQVLQWESDEVLTEINNFYQENEILLENDRRIEDGVWHLLGSCVALKPGKIQIVIDGLDECAQPLSCVQYLTKLAGKSKVGVLLSGRREDRDIFNHRAIQTTLKKRHINFSQLEITPDRTSKDLLEFVSDRVNSHYFLTTRSQEIRSRIIKGVCDRVNGMFLYANLILEDLKGDKWKFSSTSAINATLANLPKGMFDIYTQQLQTPRKTIKGSEIFCWILCAMPALTWHELQSALAIGENGYDEDEIVEDSCEVFIENSCGNLVEVFGDSERLRFIHPTVKEFLLDPVGPGSSLGVAKAHSMIASKLLTFLDYHGLPKFASSDLDENVDTTIQAYSQQPGRGLYSYATFNWYRHLKECDKLKDEDLERKVIQFIMSPAIIRWIKSAIIISRATGYGPAGSTSLIADVILNLQGWISGRIWCNPESGSIAQSWIKDFVDLMLDWGKVLETQADWIHFIQHQLLPENSIFRKILKDDEDESILQLNPRRIPTKSSQAAIWPNSCFGIDEKRDLAYAFDDYRLSCYHMRTGLLTSETIIPVPSKTEGPLVFRRGVLCPQSKYLAIVLEETSDFPDPVRNRLRAGLQIIPSEDGFEIQLEKPTGSQFEAWFAHLAIGLKDTQFVVYLFQLNHEGGARRNLFGVPSWATSPILTHGSQSLRWILDDVDTLAFSLNSSALETPFGIFDMESGSKSEPRLFATCFAGKGGKTTEDLKTIVSIAHGFLKEDKTNIVVYSIEHANIVSEIPFNGIGHLLAISNRGRFILVLKVEIAEPSKTGRKKSGDRQQLLIEIWDRSEESWIKLLILEPSASGELAPRNLCPLDFPARFSSETTDQDDPNRVLVYVPRKWKLASIVRNRNSFDTRQAQLLIFEAGKLGRPEEGFGKYPALRLQLPASSFRKRTSVSGHTLKILSWNAKLSQAIIYSHGDIVSMSLDELKAASEAVSEREALVKRIESEKPVNVKQLSTILFSADRASAFQVVLSFNAHSHNDKTLSIESERRIQEYGGFEYDIAITRLAAGEFQSESLRLQHVALPEACPPLESQLLCAIDENTLVLGPLEFDLDYDDAGELDISVRNSSETVFCRALQCFKDKAHPLSVPNRASTQTSPTHRHHDFCATIFSHSEIMYETSGPEMEEIQGAFLAQGGSTAQDDLHIFQFSRHLKDNKEASNKWESSQFEIFLCVYNASSNDITWLTQTTTAGDNAASRLPYLETAWALHPELPLLVWSIPGHRLRLSNVSSKESPVTIAESVLIEGNATQPIIFSPEGRYIALQAQEACKHVITSSIGQVTGTVMICDLVEGMTIIAIPTLACRISIGVDNEFLYTYHLTRDGAIEENTYSLPHMELIKRQCLTFVAAGCCCTTCGEYIEVGCNITVIEEQGMKLITLCHTPMRIGTSHLETQTCEPLILRITSPSVELSVNDMHDARLTIKSARFFPAVLISENEILPDAFADTHRVCKKAVDGIDCTCHRCIVEFYALVKTSPVAQMRTLISDFKLPTGEQVPPEEIEELLKKSRIASEKKYSVGPDTLQMGFSIEDAKAVAGEDNFPWDSWAEFKEAMDEIKDLWDYEAQMRKFYDDGNSGTGTRIPLLIQTFLFESGADSNDGFQWSSASGVGWIEEHAAWIHERFFGGSFEGSRTWYTFPYFEIVASRLEALMSEKSPRAERLRKYFPKLFRSPEGSKSNPLPVIEKTGSSEQIAAVESVKEQDNELAIFKLRGRGPGIVMKDGEFYGPVPKRLKDVIETLSDVAPGLGKLFEHRMNRMMTDSLVSGLYEDDFE